MEKPIAILLAVHELLNKAIRYLEDEPEPAAALKRVSAAQVIVVGELERLEPDRVHPPVAPIPPVPPSDIDNEGHTEHAGIGDENFNDKLSVKIAKEVEPDTGRMYLSTPMAMPGSVNRGCKNLTLVNVKLVQDIQGVVARCNYNILVRRSAGQELPQAVDDAIRNIWPFRHDIVREGVIGAHAWGSFDDDILDVDPQTVDQCLVVVDNQNGPGYKWINTKYVWTPYQNNWVSANLIRHDGEINK